MRVPGRRTVQGFAPRRERVLRRTGAVLGTYTPLRVSGSKQILASSGGPAFLKGRTAAVFGSHCPALRRCPVWSGRPGADPPGVFCFCPRTCFGGSGILPCFLRNFLWQRQRPALNVKGEMGKCTKISRKFLSFCAFSSFFLYCRRVSYMIALSRFAGGNIERAALYDGYCL